MNLRDYRLLLETPSFVLDTLGIIVHGLRHGGRSLVDSLITCTPTTFPICSRSIRE